MEIAYGANRVAMAQQNRQLRRQLANDFETDLKVTCPSCRFLRVIHG